MAQMTRLDALKSSLHMMESEFLTLASEVQELTTHKEDVERRHRDAIYRRDRLSKAIGVLEDVIKDMEVTQ